MYGTSNFIMHGLSSVLIFTSLALYQLECVKIPYIKILSNQDISMENMYENSYILLSKVSAFAPPYSTKFLVTQQIVMVTLHTKF
jgi:hypothetical protein